MDRTEIQKEIFEVLSQYQGAKRTPLTESSSLADELNINSARMVDILLDLEQKFGMTIDDDKVWSCKKVGDVVSLVEGLLKARQGS